MKENERIPEDGWLSIDPFAINGGQMCEALLDSVGDGLTVIDRQLRIRFQNRSVREIYGQKTGAYCFEAYRFRKEPCEACIVLEVLRDGKPRRAIRDIRLPDGDIMLVEISSSPFNARDGEIIGAVEVVRDVTAQKKAEALLNESLLEKNEVLKRLSEELKDAAGYVKSVLPRPLDTPHIQTSWLFIPSDALGGDSFGYHLLDQDHFAVYLIDVSGHGWGAALLSVSIANVLRSQTLPHTDFRKPDQVLYALNETFPAEQHNDLFFTIWYGVYDRSSRNLAYASGGHPPALLFSGSPEGGEDIRHLRTPNLIVGGQSDIRYRMKVEKIQCPSRLYVFSDGVYDIPKADGSIWGFHDFLDFFHQTSKSGGFTLNHLLDHARRLAQTDVFKDDFTILEVVLK